MIYRKLVEEVTNEIKKDAIFESKKEIERVVRENIEKQKEALARDIALSLLVEFEDVIIQKLRDEIIKLMKEKRSKIEASIIEALRKKLI